MRILTVMTCLGILQGIFAGSGPSRVSVDDVIAVVGEKVMIRAETRGLVFRKGGRLVEFFVDGRSIGKSLSGGDGVAYKKFVPMTPGISRIRVESDNSEETGLVVCVKKGSGVVFVDVEHAILEGVFPLKPRLGGQKAIAEIGKRFVVVAVKGVPLVTANTVKDWLQRYGFVQLPLIAWKEGAVFEQAAQRGLKIKAVIGGARVLESAKKHGALLFSFEEVGGVEVVKDWEEIEGRLR